MGLVAESHPPLLVKIGVTIWKVKRVPVGKRLAKLAVFVSVCEIALWGKEEAYACGGFRVSGSELTVVMAVEVVVLVAGESGRSGSLVGIVGLCLMSDIMNNKL
ncbi:hypothetical protein O6P43_012171 [Quillaja saponaria]|uniref:Uncharacterized protein n=1 Tax=Quillaja saponaria TaxID=32244 RepID=A0AAD7M153_QUISA|nr:hypothetical protein O6P43_012171 [Quillaja saponaria]